MQIDDSLNLRDQLDDDEDRPSFTRKPKKVVELPH
jgi:hypothetical protein